MHSTIRPAREGAEPVTKPWWEPAPYPRLRTYTQARTTLIHASIGLLWILASDRGLEWLGFDLEELSRLQTYKGLLYVAVTSGMLYLLIERVTRSFTRVNEALLEKHRALSTLLSNLPGGVYRRSCTGERRLEFVSEGAARLLGADRDALYTTSYSGLIHPEDRAQVEARTDAALRSHGPFTLVYRVLTAAGQVRWLWDQGRCVSSGSGQLAIEGYISDVTEHHLLRNRLHRTERLESLGQMVGGIAHDFNNVLFVVTAGSELMLAEPLPPVQREIVLQMAKAGDSGRGLVEQLLAFASAQGVEPRELELEHIVRGYEPILKRMLNGKTKLRLQLAAQEQRVRADTTQLEQVLLNLVTNAAQALQGRGSITVSTRAIELCQAEASKAELSPGKYLELSVKDDGCGIAEDVLPHIFEPFFSTKGDKGTGLGLATVHRIVRESGGAIVVESHVGLGTLFRVFLPCVAARCESLRPAAWDSSSADDRRKTG